MPKTTPKTKYSKDFEWLAPFVDSVRHLTPVHLLRKVSSSKVPIGKIEQSVGTCIKFSETNYAITILGYKQYGKRHKPEIIENVLVTLAHELAHLIHWDRHDMYFARLMSTIFSVFVEQLETYGIRDIQERHNKLWRKNEI